MEESGGGHHTGNREPPENMTHMVMGFTSRFGVQWTTPHLLLSVRCSFVLLFLVFAFLLLSLLLLLRFWLLLLLLLNSLFCSSSMATYKKGIPFIELCISSSVVSLGSEQARI